MTESAVLIAGFSGRALAASARRAGFRPLVVDAFGDTDTRRLASAMIVLPEALRQGFRGNRLMAALAELVAGDRQAHARRTGDAAAPIGLVLGAGFEDAPALVAALARHYRLIGCPPDVVEATKSPARFFGCLAKLGIAHPETQIDAPACGSGWLTKRVGGSGGTHIARCGQHVTNRRDRYYQRPVAGEPMSMLGLVGRRSSAFAFSRQWPAPMPRRPFRYGGGVGNLTLDEDLEARMVSIGLDVSQAFGLVGMISLDFIVADGTPMLLEVNPRPGASLDLFDDAAGTLFRAHVEACQDGDPAETLAAGWSPPTRAAAYLYADEGALTVPDIAWPEWTADRPAAGSLVPRFRPLATVSADAATPTAAEAALHERMGRLAQLLYRGQKTGKEMPL